MTPPSTTAPLDVWPRPQVSVVRQHLQSPQALDISCGDGVILFLSPASSLKRSFRSFLLQRAQKDRAGRWGCGGRGHSGLPLTLHLHPSSPERQPRYTCQGPPLPPRGLGLTWWPTVFLCSLLEAFRGGLAERTLIFEDVAAAGAESLPSWNKSATRGS